MMKTLCVSVLLVLSAACGGGSSAPSSPDVWAVVNGREIRRDAVEKAYRRVAPPNATATEEEKVTAKLGLLNEMIVQDILVARANELSIQVTDNEVDNAYIERKKNMPEDAFQKELNMRGLSIEDMKASLRRELLADKVVEREVNAKVAVTDQEIADYFNSHKAQFNLAEPAYRVAQIVITPVKEAQLGNRTGHDATTPETANAKAQMLMTQLKGGADFAQLALDYSEDPQTAQRGGDLGFLPLSQLNQAPPALRDAVLKSTPGSVKLVSDGGAHSLVLLVAKEDAGQRDLTMPGVKDGIMTTMRNQRTGLLRNAYLTAARADAQVTNYLARQIVQSTGKVPASSLLPAVPEKK